MQTNFPQYDRALVAATAEYTLHGYFDDEPPHLVHQIVVQAIWRSALKRIMGPVERERFSHLSLGEQRAYFRDTRFAFELFRDDFYAHHRKYRNASVH